MKQDKAMNKQLSFSKQIPDEENVTTFEKNAWISPSGEFWGFEGAKHEIAATYIAIFRLGANDKTLKKGAFFNESWEGWLLKQGWLNIKNVSWLTGDSRPSTFAGLNWTNKQKSTVFDYCEFFGFDYQEIFDGAN